MMMFIKLYTFRKEFDLKKKEVSYRAYRGAKTEVSAMNNKKKTVEFELLIIF